MRKNVFVQGTQPDLAIARAIGYTFERQVAIAARFAGVVVVHDEITFTNARQAPKYKAALKLECAIGAFEEWQQDMRASQRSHVAAR